MGQNSALSLLLVEPSRAQFHILQSRFEEFGVTDVWHAKTGAAALDAIAKKQPSLVISSMHLPDMTGTALAQRIRSQPETETLLFALLSSERSPRFLEPIRQAGVLSILEKPLQRESLNHLLLSIHEILRVDEIEFAGYLDEIRVLLVDDSRTARRFIRQVLESLGLERFTEVGDGTEAHALLQEESFDLIVTDLNMPKMDGMELTRLARTESLRPEVPIIMVTSEQSPARRAQAMDAGLSALIEKPFEPGLVRGLLEELLDVG